MDHKTVEKYILSMPNARLDYPFGKEAAVYKVLVPAASSASYLDAVQGSSDERTSRRRATVSKRGSVTDAVMSQEPAGATGSAGGQGKVVRGDWKMFAIIMEGKDPIQLSLKCDPNLAERLRAKYDTVLPGYHLNKKHWNTIVLTGQLSWDEIKDLIKHSYDLVTKK